MRWGVALAALLCLNACIPHGETPRRPPRAAPLPRAAPQPPQQSSQATLQCHVDLAREGVQFRVLPDQRFAGGCSALGAVQLLDIGVPVTNLRAMTCPLARAFTHWAREAVQPAAAQWLGSRVARVETFGTYSCRSVDSQPGARLSEHARANAVDVSGFLLADGRHITVREGWNGEDERVRGFLRAIHQGGCRRFAIGLSPDSDSYHYNHLHFDMGRGPYCH
jgi:hypothetical protein